jgi:chaperone required for assembly of F1-ATPase
MPVKRFYKDVTVIPAGTFHEVCLDGRAARTPARNKLTLPTKALAQAIAQEWEGQGDNLDSTSMPLTRLANAAIDGVANSQDEVRADIVKYAGSDLVCYRAESPAPLVERQNLAWDAILGWSRDRLDAPLLAVQGVVFAQQPSKSLQNIASKLSSFTPFQLAALHSMTTLMGSCLLAMAVAYNFHDADTVWNAAHIDEDWIIEQWGEDAEASQRRTSRKREMDAAARFFELSNG